MKLKLQEAQTRVVILRGHNDANGWRRSSALPTSDDHLLKEPDDIQREEEERGDVKDL